MATVLKNFMYKKGNVLYPNSTDEITFTCKNKNYTVDLIDKTLALKEEYFPIIEKFMKGADKNICFEMNNIIQFEGNAADYAINLFCEQYKVPVFNVLANDLSDFISLYRRFAKFAVIVIDGDYNDPYIRSTILTTRFEIPITFLMRRNDEIPYTHLKSYTFEDCDKSKNAKVMQLELKYGIDRLKDIKSKNNENNEQETPGY